MARLPGFLVFLVCMMAHLAAVAAVAPGPDPWCGANSGKKEARALRVEWVPATKEEFDPNGSVRVRDARTGEVLHEIGQLENWYAHSEAIDPDDATAPGIDTRDFNNDGCRDLAVLQDKAGIGNESHAVFLYERATRRFVPHEGLSAIGGLDIDDRDRNCVTGFWKGGAADLGTEKHCWVKGKLVKREEYSVSPVYRDDEFQCYQHVTTTYTGSGRKKVKRACTKEF